MSEKIISISQHPNFRPKGQRLRKRLFDLGWHSGPPGFNWKTNYWVKKVRNGALWKLYWFSEYSTGTPIYGGRFETKKLRYYFDAVRFELPEDEWLRMGLGMPAEVIELYPKQSRPNHLEYYQLRGLGVED